MAQLLKPVFSLQFKKQYKRLPANLQKKFIKQLNFLIQNYRHPSLAAKKMGGKSRFEARLDRHYRFTFQIENDEIILRNIGPHDVGLGKK